MDSKLTRRRRARRFAERAFELPDVRARSIGASIDQIADAAPAEYARGARRIRPKYADSLSRHVVRARAESRRLRRRRSPSTSCCDARSTRVAERGGRRSRARRRRRSSRSCSRSLIAGCDRVLAHALDQPPDRRSQIRHARRRRRRSRLSRRSARGSRRRVRRARATASGR